MGKQLDLIVFNHFTLVYFYEIQIRLEKQKSKHFKQFSMQEDLNLLYF